jgi:hypothetical protein
MAVREMSEEEKVECETITKEMHAQARNLLKDKEKTVWLFKPKPPEPVGYITTPMGEYQTSASIAKEVQEFFDSTRRENTGAIGGQYSYTFTDTQLGLILEIKDGFTNKTINATDFSEF